MTKDLLQEIWDQDRKESKRTIDELEISLRPLYKKSGSRWSVTLVFYLAFVAVTLVFQGMSIYAFHTNSLMLAVGISLAVCTLGFLGYGIYVLRSWTAIDLIAESLVAKLKRRLRFCRTTCEVWLWMIALNTVFLSFAVNTVVDVKDGVYHINNLSVFLGITLTQLLLVYSSLKIAQSFQVRETTALLEDLEQENPGATEKLHLLRKKSRRWVLVLVALLSLLLLWGVMAALQ